MKRPIQLMIVIVLSGLTTRGDAQEAGSDSKISKQLLQMQLENEIQRVKLFQEQVSLLKSLQKIETKEGLTKNEARKMEKDVLEAEVKASAAASEFAKANVDRLKKLYERNAISQTDYFAAQQEVTRSEIDHMKALAAVEQRQKEIAAAELALKRRQIQNLFQISDARLKLLEAEYQVQQLKLQIGDEEAPQ